MIFACPGLVLEASVAVCGRLCLPVYPVSLSMAYPAAARPLSARLGCLLLRKTLEIESSGLETVFNEIKNERKHKIHTWYDTR